MASQASEDDYVGKIIFPLLEASKRGYTEQITEALSQNGGKVNQKDTSGNTGLHWAASGMFLYGEWALDCYFPSLIEQQSISIDIIIRDLFIDRYRLSLIFYSILIIWEKVQRFLALPQRYLSIILFLLWFRFIHYSI